LKAAFNIPHAITGNNSLSLLIEAGDHGIYFLWFIKAPFSVKGLVAYNFTEGVTATDIKNIFDSLDGSLSGLSSTTICYDFKQSILIPAKYNQEEIAEKSLSLVYGDNSNVVLNADKVTSANIHVHYRIPAGIDALFGKHFPKAAIFHATSLQLEMLNQEKDLLYCIFYHDSLKLILYKDGKLQIVQQFNYTIPDDAAYHLLNACEQFGIKPSEIKLRLSGMIDEHSKLYMELRNYFLNISFEAVADGIITTSDMKEFPAHFFSHLISLALCVS
jgi:hypothetical protein